MVNIMELAYATKGDSPAGLIEVPVVPQFPVVDLTNAVKTGEGPICPSCLDNSLVRYTGARVPAVPFDQPQEYELYGGFTIYDTPQGTIEGYSPSYPVELTPILSEQPVDLYVCPSTSMCGFNTRNPLQA
jgi:hypothetical protein